MAIFKRIFGLLLLLSLAAVFILSGWSKLQDLEPFAWSFIDILPIKLFTASIFARLFIGLEWLIAGWLIAHLYLRTITYKAAIALLLLLSAYLAGLIIVQGNEGNCGCFGEWLYMKPAAAIWKNVVLLAGLGLLYFIYPGRPYPNRFIVALSIAVAAFVLPFALEPIRIHTPANATHEPINLDPIYQHGRPVPHVELRRGKRILCFFSTTCPHCVKGAYLLHILHRRYPDLPLYMVLNGTDSLRRHFLAESKADAVPHSLLSDTQAFTSMSGEFVPAIYWINNGVIERKTHYTELEPGAIRTWLGR